MENCYNWKFRFLSLGNFKIVSFWRLSSRLCVLITIKKLVVDIRHAYKSHGKKKSKFELKWMSHECSKLATQEKFRKNHLFSFFGPNNYFKIIPNSTFILYLIIFITPTFLLSIKSQENLTKHQISPWDYYD